MKPSEDRGGVLAESLRHEKVDERVNGCGGFRKQRSNQTKLSRDLLEHCFFSRENESKTIAGDMIMIIIIIIITRPKTLHTDFALALIPDICHGRHGHVRVNFFWPV